MSTYSRHSDTHCTPNTCVRSCALLRCNSSSICQRKYITIEQWWNDDSDGKTEETQCHFVHRESHIKLPETGAEGTREIHVATIGTLEIWLLRFGIFTRWKFMLWSVLLCRTVWYVATNVLRGTRCLHIQARSAVTNSLMECNIYYSSTVIYYHLRHLIYWRLKYMPGQ